MGVLSFIAEDFRRMKNAFKEFFHPKPIGSAEEFIARFEQKESIETKEQALKRLGLDRIPCRLTDDDIRGFNDTEEKYKQFRDYMSKLEAFEREWKE